MSDPIIARKYATALFETARRRGLEDEVNADLHSLLALRDTGVAIQQYLLAPSIRTDTKKSAVNRVLKGRVQELTLRLILILMDKKRVRQFPGICQHYEDLVRRHRGIIRARVRSAIPLEAPQVDRLRTSLGRLTGRTIEVDSHIDPGVLGGVVVEFENQIIDRSVRRGLDDLRDTLLKVRVL